MPGSIIKRGKSSWTVVVDIGRDPVTGKRRQLWRGVKGTKRDAETLLVQLLHQRDSGIDAPPGKITVSEYLNRWLDDYARPNTAPKTHMRYEEVIRLHLVPVLGSIPLAKLRPLHIQEAYRRALAKGLSPRTVLHCHRVLREALKHALKWQLIARNPADAAEPPRFERREIKALPPEDLRRILTAADDTPYGTLVHLAATTGLRRGELLGLRWQDVDLETGMIHVRQTAQRLPGQGITFRPPKTHRSSRPVSISPSTVERLRQHRRGQLEERMALGPDYEDHDLVLATPLGMPNDPGNLRRAWGRIVKAAGVDSMRFHDLRHAHATLLLQQGVHPKVVSERLGHAGVAITLDTYSHVLPGLQEEAAEKLDRVLGLE